MVLQSACFGFAALGHSLLLWPTLGPPSFDILELRRSSVKVRAELMCELELCIELCTEVSASPCAELCA